MTLYFYDLETTGFNPRDSRIVQFAGQRTDMDLNEVGEPHNFLIKLTEDVLPDPDAVLITGITPQKTITEGITEAEFLQRFYEEIALPDTIFTGFNSIRFDDEFMRYLHYRNFYDPYEWQWQDGRSRWELLDMVRMTRALRPDGIKWPFGSTGKANNRLASLTSINELAHEHIHDALSDVQASLALTRLVKDKQPKLFDWLLSIRDKKRIAQFVQSNELFIYTSGKYPNEVEKTAIVTAIAEPGDRQGALVYDLRQDPTPFANMSAAELAAAWRLRKSEEGTRLPIKLMAFNRCPAIAPLNVLDEASMERLKLDMDEIQKHHTQLNILKDFANRIQEAWKLLEQKRQAALLFDDRTVDEQLYDGFFDNTDKTEMSKLRVSQPSEISHFSDRFKDSRLKALVPLYKARNFPKHLTNEEREVWERYRQTRLLSGEEDNRLARYFRRISELSKKPDLDGHQQYLLKELELYGQNVIAAD